MFQQLSDRITNLEKIISDKHENPQGYLDALKLQHGTPEEQAAQAKKAQDEKTAKENR